MTPFLNLPRAVFHGEISVIASSVAYVEIVTSTVAYHLVVGLASGKILESPPFEPTDKNLTLLREYRDQILDDIAAKLSVPDARPAYATLPEA